MRKVFEGLSLLSLAVLGAGLLGVHLSLVAEEGRRLVFGLGNLLINYFHRHPIAWLEHPVSCPTSLVGT